MTTTAIALFGTRVSPRFDCAQDFMVITTADNAVTEQHTETIREPMPVLKVRRLAALKVNTLICGGIDESSREYLRSHGITVIANKKGQATDAVTSYLSSPAPA
ncbi:MAG: NifB/NifX family molybdenum-iron cluster-binding protein [Proteobacteria bacterium]|nr:NifB/NifX family molybdenum-iron cluster-binding protein [Pseudomonadota bacterium]MDP2104950.1 NifB/NifX family molybdenum-iron cluster-binding protein [Desulfobulbaceae bacterium]